MQWWHGQPREIFPTLSSVRRWAAVWFDSVFCLIPTSDGHPPLQGINVKFGVCCLYPLSLEASWTAEGCGQEGLGSGSPPEEEASTHPHAKPQPGEPKVIPLTEASALVPHFEGLGNLLDGRDRVLPPPDHGPLAPLAMQLFLVSLSP